MPRRVALSTLRERCQRRADLENDQHISTAEWNALLAEKYAELYGLVCETGARYFETTSTITATGATSYNEPTDHYVSVGLDYSSSDTRRRLTQLRPSETNAYANLTGDAFAWSHVDDQIYLHPNPSSGSYVLRYIPQAPDLSSYADADLVDVMTSDGEAALIWGVVVLAKSKSESDVRLALEREAHHRNRLEYWAADMAVGDGHRAMAYGSDDDDAPDAADWRWSR